MVWKSYVTAAAAAKRDRKFLLIEAQTARGAISHYS